MEYLIVKWLHILSSTILFGTGIGSAFYLLVTSLTRDAKPTAHVARWVVIADWIFTTPTVFLQPATGLYLMRLAGLQASSGWLRWAWLLYGIAIASWLPVVWLQIQMRDLALHAADAGAQLPERYWACLRWWITLGCIAFVAFLAIFYLMVLKPT
jgi:uncharacterized membrane protein